MKVLIVEDDRVSACFLRRLVEQQGHEVVLAENGEEAWELLRADAFSVVLSDWLMPKMDGLQLCREIRARQGTAYIYVILFTSKDQREDRLAGLRAGADDFLTKPLDSDELYARLAVAERLLSMEAELKRKTSELEKINKALAKINQQNDAYVAEIRETCRELEGANAQLKMQSITDGLTGLKNHREFQERLEDEINRAIRYHLPLSLIMMDVDHFKRFNDTFGHPAGDEVLKRVARLLESHARDTDILARYGGEEFAVILANTDHENAMAAAERYRLAMIESEWEHCPVHVSIGVATLRLLPQTRAELTTEADMALYVSKHLGRNRVSHYADTVEKTVS